LAKDILKFYGLENKGIKISYADFASE